MDWTVYRLIMVIFWPLFWHNEFVEHRNDTHLDCKVHGANMDPIWVRQDPGGPHVGPRNFAIWADGQNSNSPLLWIYHLFSYTEQWAHKWWFSSDDVTIDCTAHYETKQLLHGHRKLDIQHVRYRFCSWLMFMIGCGQKYRIMYGRWWITITIGHELYVNVCFIGIILSMGSTNERRCHNVTSYLIG